MAPKEVQVLILGTQEYVILCVMFHVMLHVNVIQSIHCSGKNKMCVCVCVCVCVCMCVCEVVCIMSQLSVTLWTIARQAPLSMGLFLARVLE